LAVGACLSAPKRPSSDTDAGNTGAADASVADGALIDGALIDGALIDGALIDGPLVDGPLVDGPLADAATPDALMPANTHAALFTAASQHYLAAADAPSLDVSDAITVELWLKLTSLPATDGRSTLITKLDYDQPQDTFALQLHDVGGQLRIEFRVEGRHMGLPAKDMIGWVWNSVSVGTWHHVAVSYELNPGAAVLDKFALYLDGSPVTGLIILSQEDLDQIENTGVPVTVGAMVPTSGPVSFADATMDDIRLWNVVRSATDISNHYAEQLSGSEAGLIAYWKLNNTFTDATSNGNDLAVVGDPAPAFVTDTPF